MTIPLHKSTHIIIIVVVVVVSKVGLVYSFSGFSIFTSSCIKIATVQAATRMLVNVRPAHIKSACVETVKSIKVLKSSGYALLSTNACAADTSAKVCDMMDATPDRERERERERD